MEDVFRYAAFLAIWIIGSVPLALFLGAVIKQGSRMDETGADEREIDPFGAPPFGGLITATAS